MSSYKDLVLVYQAKGRLNAEAVKCFLEAQGIETWINQAALGQVYGFTVGQLGRVDLLVKPDDEDRAHKLLLEMEAGDFSDETLVDDPQDSLLDDPNDKPILE